MPTTLRNTDILFNDGSTQTSAAIKGIRTKTFTTSQTYTKPSDVVSIAFFVSGSTGSILKSGNKGGVGGAGYSEKYIASPSASYVITIGAAGTSGGGGGTTTVDTISITGSAGTTTAATGTAGGVASGGTFNANGGAGGAPGHPTIDSGGGGGGAGGSRAGNGFAGGTGGTNSGGGGGGGGTGAVGSTGVSGTGGAGGAGGAGATTTSASAITLNPYWVPASGGFPFPVGVGGSAGEPSTPYGGQGGRGADGTVGAGVYNLTLQGGLGGFGGSPVQYGTLVPGQSGIVQIWEFLA